MEPEDVKPETPAAQRLKHIAGPASSKRPGSKYSHRLLLLLSALLFLLFCAFVVYQLADGVFSFHTKQIEGVSKPD